jgi:hypothetical protein
MQIEVDINRVASRATTLVSVMRVCSAVSHRAHTRASCDRQCPTNVGDVQEFVTLLALRSEKRHHLSQAAPLPTPIWAELQESPNALQAKTVTLVNRPPFKKRGAHSQLVLVLRPRRAKLIDALADVWQVGCVSATPTED